MRRPSASVAAAAPRLGHRHHRGRRQMHQRAARRCAIEQHAAQHVVLDDKAQRMVAEIAWS